MPSFLSESATLEGKILKVTVGGRPEGGKERGNHNLLPCRRGPTPVALLGSGRCPAYPDRQTDEEAAGRPEGRLSGIAQTSVGYPRPRAPSRGPGGDVGVGSGRAGERHRRDRPNGERSWRRRRSESDRSAPGAAATRMNTKGGGREQPVPLGRGVTPRFPPNIRRRCWGTGRLPSRRSRPCVAR